MAYGGVDEIPRHRRTLPSFYELPEAHPKTKYACEHPWLFKVSNLNSLTSSVAADSHRIDVYLYGTSRAKSLCIEEEASVVCLGRGSTGGTKEA